MTGGLDPGVARGRLRRQLRDARRRAGLSQLDAAVAVDWSRSKVTRIEAGHVRLSRSDLLTLLAVYGIDDSATIHELVDLARVGRRQLWSEYRDVFPARFLTYLGYEHSAASVQVFDATFIPELLQTADLARRHIETLAAPGTTSEAMRRVLESRLTRQARLHDQDGPAAHFLIDETALRRGLGGPDTTLMRDQLRSLTRSADLATITIQIIPLQAGLYPGLAGPFTVLSTPEHPDNDLVYVHHDWTGSYSAGYTEHLDRYRRLFTTLTRLALPPDQSIKMLDTLTVEQPTEVRT